MVSATDRLKAVVLFLVRLSGFYYDAFHGVVSCLVPCSHVLFSPV